MTQSTSNPKQNIFILEEKELAKILGISLQELDKIIEFFDSDPHDEWDLEEGVDFCFSNISLKKRVFSPEGANSIAHYIDEHPEYDSRNIFKKLTDWIFNAKQRVRRSLVRQHIITTLDIHDSGIVRQKSGHDFINRKACVALVKTSYAKWNSVFKDIQQSSTPFIPGEHLEEDIDLKENFFRSDALSRVGLQLSKELKNKQRRLWCEDFSLECEPVIKKLMSEEEARQKRIQAVKEKAKRRDKKRCQVTHVHRDKYNNVVLEAHHLYCAKHFPHLADIENNLITLSSEVHQEFHTFMKGTKNPCTADDFLNFLHERYPDSTEHLGHRLENIKKVFGNPQLKE